MMRESLFPWKFGRFALAAVTVLLFLGAGDRQSVQAATTAQATPGIGAWRIGTHDLDLSESTLQLGRYSVVVIPPYQYARVAQIKADYLRCPSCMRKLKDPCPSCARPLDPAWRICPYCEAEVAPERARRRSGEPSAL